jgi:hypothetical protein
MRESSSSAEGTRLGRRPAREARRISAAHTASRGRAQAQNRHAPIDKPMAGMKLEEKEDMCRFILDANK